VWAGPEPLGGYSLTHNEFDVTAERCDGAYTPPYDPPAVPVVVNPTTSIPRIPGL